MSPLPGGVRALVCEIERAVTAREIVLDALARPRCGGRMVRLAMIEETRIVGRILGHLGLPTEIPQPRRAPSPPAVRDLFGDASD